MITHSREPGVLALSDRAFTHEAAKRMHGILGVTVATPAQWAGFCQIIGRPELSREMKYSTGFEGVIPYIERKFLEAESDSIQATMKKGKGQAAPTDSSVDARILLPPERERRPGRTAGARAH